MKNLKMIMFAATLKKTSLILFFYFIFANSESLRMFQDTIYNMSKLDRRIFLTNQE